MHVLARDRIDDRVEVDGRRRCPAVAADEPVGFRLAAADERRERALVDVRGGGGGDDDDDDDVSVAAASGEWCST